jgi:tetratricopeptide (TPR) repeat protein
MGPTHWDTLTARFNRAVPLAYLGRYVEANNLLAIGHDPNIEIKLPHWYAQVCGIVYRVSGDYPKAIAKLREAIAMVRSDPKAEWDLLRLHAELGHALLATRQWAAAETSYREAQRLASVLRVEDHPLTVEVLAGVGRIAFERRAPGRGVAELERADAYWRRVDAANPIAVDTARWLGRARTTPRLRGHDEREHETAMRR